MEAKKPTVREIAKEAGLHHATVARILKNQGRVSEETRKKVMAIAERVGYGKNPLLSAWMAQRRSLGSAQSLANIAVVVGDYTLYKKQHPFKLMEAQYLATAKAHGYHLSFLCLKSLKTQRRLLSVLQARNVLGIIWHANLEMDFSNPLLNSFAHVSYAARHSSMLLVKMNARDAIANIMEQLRQRQIRRPVLVESKHMTRIVFSEYEAAFLWYYREMKFRKTPRILPFSTLSKSRVLPTALIRKEGFDAIIAQDRIKSEPRLPTAYLSLNTNQRFGIRQNRERMAQVLVEQLVAKISRGDFGLNRETAEETILVKGKWVD